MGTRKNISYFYVLSIFHIGSVLIGMTVTARMILVNIAGINHSFHVTGGIFFIPAVFFIQDIVTEIYGYENAKKMLRITLAIFILYVLALYFIALIPCGYNNQACESFAIMAKALPRLGLSFVLSLAVGGTLNNYILTKLKLVFDSKFLAIRFISATAIGEMIFQTIAVLISWYGTFSMTTILPLATAAYIYKIIFETLLTPLNLFICHYLKAIQIKEIENALQS